MAIAGSLIVNLEARSQQLENELRKVRFLLRQTQAEVRRLAGTSGDIERTVTRNFQRMAEGVSGLQVIAARARTAFAAFQGAVAAVGLGTIVRQSTQLADSIGSMATQVNVSIEGLQRLRFAAAQSGASAELMDRALNVLNERLGEAAAGSTDAQQKFADLGLRWQDLRRAGTEEAFLAIADAISQIPDATDRAARQAGIFGDRSRDLANTLGQGRARLIEFGQAAQRTGAVLDEESVKRLAAANSQLDKFGTQLRVVVARAVVPLTPLITALGESIDRMAGALATGNAEWGNLSNLESAVVRFFQNVSKVVAELLPHLQSTITDLNNIISLFEKAQQLATSLPATGREVPTQRRATLEQMLETLSRQPASEARAAREQAARAELDLLRAQLTPERFRTGGLEGPEALGAVAAFKTRPPPPPFTVPGKPGRGAAADRDEYALAIQQIERFAEAMRLAGQPVDTLNERINALSAGIRERLSEGVPPAAEAVQSLVRQFLELQRQLAENEARLEGLGGLTALGDFPDITPVLTTLNQELRNLETSIQVFGPSADDASRRTELFRTALQQAIEAGILPFDTELQRLQRRFENAQQAEAWGRAVARGLEIAEQAAAATNAEYLQLAETLNEQFRQPIERLREFQAQVESIPAGLLDEKIGARAIRDAQIEFARTTVLGQGIITIADGITEAFDQSFQGIIQGTISVSDAFKNMAQSILLSISRILLQKGVTALLNVVLSGLAPGPTGGAFAGAAGGAGGFQQGGFVPGRRGAGDIVPAFLSPGEFIVRRQAVEALGATTLAKINAMGYQQGGPVVPPVAHAANNRAQPGITINNIVVRDQQEANARRQELEQLDGHIVNVINKQILGGDGSLINRSLTMVRGGR